MTKICVLIDAWSPPSGMDIVTCQTIFTMTTT